MKSARRLLCTLLAVVAAQVACVGWLPAGEASSPGEGSRVSIPLMTEWEFHKGAIAEKVGSAGFAGTGEWRGVTLPHTWNAEDGESKNYFRGDGWYRRKVTIGSELAGKELYLRFEGANRRAEVFVNGERAGGHVGGTEAFVVDITRQARSGENDVVVHVDNKRDPDSPPLQADFTFFGGLYRAVELVGVNPVHVSLTDFGSAGVYVTTPRVTGESAAVQVKTLVENSGAGADGATQVDVQVVDAEGEVVAERATACVVGAGKVSEAVTELGVASPHLWDGVHDPYLYSVRVMVKEGERVVDSVTQPLGIRTMRLDPEQGFFLNGKPYPLYGVCRHQDREGKGWAISEEDQVEDMGFIKEMGCTSVRLAHYPQSNFFYGLCDKAGIVVWAEVPVVDRLGSSEAFTKNARQQYTELIKQNFNHPSIAFWSAGNEVDPTGGNFNRKGPAVYPWFKKMGELGHELDPSRFTAAAYRERFYPPADNADVFGLNPYLGWYNDTYNDLEEYLQKHEANGARGHFAFTEFGAGASIYFHSEHPVRMDHTEEYQNLFHEHYWGVLKNHPEVWGKYIWNMFDFAVGGRAEGDHAGINDKGLVTYDRRVRKDAFYFYKASWSQEPVVYITSRRFAVRGLEQIPIKVYSNAGEVSLRVNGVEVGRLATPGNVVFQWEGVKLKEGPNLVEAMGTFSGGRVLTDEVTFTYTPGAPLEVYLPQDETMRRMYREHPPRAPVAKPAAGAEGEKAAAGG
ncbi:MAG: glycoside hydrolase family 2 TIM barrel-domain containing protein [Phycisphaerae bacterium]